MEGMTLANSENEYGKLRKLIIKLHMGKSHTTWSAQVQNEWCSYFPIQSENKPCASTDLII